MLNPFFSVVIPSYNQGKYLKKALDSVFNQTYNNFEVILIDNNSTDNTKKIIKAFKKKIIYKKIKNLGVIAKSRNKGISISRGKWVAFLDSDDYWEKNKLKNIYKKIKKNNFDVICHDEWIVNIEGKKNNLWTYGPYEKNFYKNLLIYGNRNSTSASVVKKNFLKHHKIEFNESKSFVTAEDYDFFLKIAQKKGVFYYLNKPLGFHLMHDLSYSSKKDLHLKSIKNVIKKHVYKVQKFDNSKKLLEKKILDIIKIRNLFVEFKNINLDKKSIKSLITFIVYKPILIILTLKMLFLKFLRSFFTIIFK